MIITIENTKLQKHTKVEVPDDFYTEAEDMLVHLDLERFKLVSTKSEEDKRREALAVEFGETYYHELYDKFPDFGEEGCLLTREACKDIIKAKLTGKFEELLKDRNPDLLLNSLVTAFGNYCQVKTKMDERDAEIRHTRIHENVFFDYILRLEKVFHGAKTIKDVTEGIAQCHDYAMVDERQIYGYAYIFEQLKPYFNWSSELDKELKEMKPYKPISDQPFYTEEDYFNNHVIDVAKEVANNLINLKSKYDKWINETMQKTGVTAYNDYLNQLYTEYVKMSETYDRLTEQVQKENEKTDVEKLEAVKDEFRDAYKSFIRFMVDTRIYLELDPRPWSNDAEKDFFLSHCGFVDYWYNQVTGNKEANAGDKFMMQLKHHLPIIKALIDKKIEVVKLLDGQYDQSFLKDLMEGKNPEEV